MNNCFWFPVGGSLELTISGDLFFVAQEILHGEILQSAVGYRARFLKEEVIEDFPADGKALHRHGAAGQAIAEVVAVQVDIGKWVE